MTRSDEAIDRISTDDRCVECGYALLGLPVSGVCPECAKPVEASVRSAPFRQLSDTDAASFLRGLNRLLLSLHLGTIGVVTLVLLIFSTKGELVIVGLAVFFTAVGAWFVGWSTITGVRVAGEAPRGWQRVTWSCGLGVVLPPLYSRLAPGHSERISLLLASGAAVSFVALALIGQRRLGTVVADTLDENAHELEEASTWAFRAAAVLFLLMGVLPVEHNICGAFGIAGVLALLAAMTWLWRYLPPIRRAAQRRCAFFSAESSAPHR